MLSLAFCREQDIHIVLLQLSLMFCIKPYDIHLILLVVSQLCSHGLSVLLLQGCLGDTTNYS